MSPPAPQNRVSIEPVRVLRQAVRIKHHLQACQPRRCDDAVHTIAIPPRRPRRRTPGVVRRAIVWVTAAATTTACRHAQAYLEYGTAYA